MMLLTLSLLLGTKRNRRGAVFLNEDNTVKLHLDQFDADKDQKCRIVMLTKR